MNTGSIVFGPRETSAADGVYRQTSGLNASITARPYSMGCNCIGPQRGQSKCPCALVAEMEQADRMLSDGVIIAGKRYKLVPDEGNGK